MKVIARIHNDFPTKFGLPRQSGLAPSLLSRIVFEEEYRNPDALRGLDGFSHLWLIWDFSEFHDADDSRAGGWSPTVRPPRLGGNARLGVFATRSPHRPNPIGLSCVKIEAIELDTPEGPQIVVSGADLMDGTPIFDIKPYLPGVESHPDARDGFVGGNPQTLLDVEIAPEVSEVLKRVLSAEKIVTLREILSQDPRPAYHNDPERVYGVAYAGLDLHFKVSGSVLTVVQNKPQIMAVLNATPDSFIARTRYDMAVLDSGADIIDIGAVSSRPGAAFVSEEEEWSRLLPVLEAVKEKEKALSISIDTTRSSIVRKVYEFLGRSFIVNDISAGEEDPLMLATVAELNLPFVAMHKRGDPASMDGLTDYPNGVVEAVLQYFREFSQRAETAGVREWILDPGFGFAKTDAQNYELLHHLADFKVFGRPVLVGVADKRFTHGNTAMIEEEASLRGADILRVHI